MSLRVAHIVSSVRPEPGSVAVCLPGLIERLRQGGIESSITEPGAIPDADVVHVHGWNDGPTRDRVLSLAKSRRRFVLSPLGGLSTGQYNPWSLRDKLKFAFRQRRGIQAAWGLVAANQLEADQLASEARHSRIVVLPYGTTAAPETTPADVAGPKRLLYLGSLHPRFGCVALLLAVAELGAVADGWRVDVAGAGDAKWRLKLEAAIRRKGADDRVRFVAADDLPTQSSLLRAASLVVTPSLHYDAGVSILQAAATGIPVMATRRAVPPELENAVTSCEPKRDALRQALHAVMSLSDADRIALGRRGYEAARRSLDWSVLAPRYAAFYEEVARG